MPSTSNKKYKLMSQASLSDPHNRPLCAFFSSEAGCRNGSKCNFAHVDPSSAANKHRPPSSNNVSSSSSSSAVSSEESEEEGQNHPLPPAQIEVADNSSKKKRKRNAAVDNAEVESESTSPFAPRENQTQAGQSHQLQQKQSKKKKQKQKKSKQQQSTGTELASVTPVNVTSVAPTGGSSVQHSASQQQQAKKKKKKSKKMKKEQQQNDHDDNPFLSPDVLPSTTSERRKEQSPAGQVAAPPPKPAPLSDFRSLLQNLPVASFSIPEMDGDDNDGKSEEEDEDEDDDGAETSSPLSSTNKANVSLPLPKNSTEAMKWSAQILQTRKHVRYASSFDYAKAKEIDPDKSTGWVKAKPYGPWCASNPQVIALDCEMCETQDPVTGKTNPGALCRLSVVNGSNPDEVLLDTLVKPTWPVRDHRSRINGIGKAHLAEVQFTLRHAQEFMMALCSEETVIVGHALQNDFAALKMEHHCNIDSSLLFPVSDENNEGGRIVPSLKDVAKSVMNKVMPKTHDSVNDARTALLCADIYRQKEGKVDPVVRTVRPRAGEKLFVHRLPKNVKAEHLSAMFLHHTCIMPKAVETIEFTGNTGKTHVVFASVLHANLAFNTLSGKAEPDKSMMLQKKVYLKNKDYVRVRKMVLPRSVSGKSNGGK